MKRLSNVIVVDGLQFDLNAAVCGHKYVKFFLTCYFIKLDGIETITNSAKEVKCGKHVITISA